MWMDSVVSSVVACSASPLEGYGKARGYVLRGGMSCINQEVFIKHELPCNDHKFMTINDNYLR